MQLNFSSFNPVKKYFFSVKFIFFPPTPSYLTTVSFTFINHLHKLDTQRKFHLQQEVSLLNFPCLHYVFFPCLFHVFCVFLTCLSQVFSLIFPGFYLVNYCFSIFLSLITQVKLLVQISFLQENRKNQCTSKCTID